MAKRLPDTATSSHYRHADVASFSRALLPILLCNRGVETLIVCLGSEHVSDDGIAAVVGKALRTLPLPSDVSVKLVSRIHFDLVDAIAAATQLVLVDALHEGAEPGACNMVEVTGLPASIASSTCAHAASISQILDIVRYLACDGNCRSVFIAGVEGRQFLSYGTPFSDEVWAAVPRLVDHILFHVGAKLEARIMVKDVCRNLAGPAETGSETWPIGRLLPTEAVA